MNYKKWVYDELESYAYKAKSLTLIPDKIRMLKIRAESIRSATSDSTPVSGTGSCSREEMLIANIAERQELERNLAAAAADVRRIDDALQALLPEERKAIEYCVIYKQKNGIPRLMKELNYEKTKAYEILNRAVYHMALLLFGSAKM